MNLLTKNLKSCYLMIIALLIIAGDMIYSQTFELEIKNIKYPNITASFRLTDKSGNVILPPEIPDIFLRQIPLNSKCDVTCPPSIKGKISVIFVLDVSKTMESYISQINGNRVFYEKALIKNAVTLLPEDTTKWEAAITIFNHNSYVIQNFTSAKSWLNKALESDSLYPHGGSDFNSAFLDDEAGALNLVAKARYNPVIIFVTDGEHNESTEFPAKSASVEVNKIISEAADYSLHNIPATIFSVYIETPTSEDIEQITQNTGGKSVESNITINPFLDNFFTDTYNSVFSSPKEYSRGCELSCTVSCEWQPGLAEFIIPSMNNLSSVYNFTDFRPRILINPKMIEYIEDSLKPQSLQIEIAPVPEPSMLKNITFNSTGLSVSDWGGAPPPFKLDSIRKITLMMNILVKETFDTIEAVIETDACKWDTLRVFRKYSPMELNTLPEYHVCDGQPSQIGDSNIVVGGKQPYRYKWQPKTGLSSDTVPNPFLTTSIEGSYKLTVTDAHNVSVSNNVAIKLDSLPEPYIVFLEGRVIEREITIYKAEYNYLLSNEWSVVNGTLLSPPTSDSAIIKWTKFGVGNIYLKQTFDNTGCYAYDSLRVSIGVNTGAEDGTTAYDCNSFRIRNFNSDNLNGAVSFDISLNQNDNARIELINLLGTVISSKEVNAGEEHIRMEAENLAAGMYFLIIKTKDCNSVRKIFIGGN